MTFHLSTRRWLVLVAIVGLLVGLPVEYLRLRRRSGDFRRKADHFAGLRQDQLALLPSLEAYARNVDDLAKSDHRFARLSAQINGTLRKNRDRIDAYTRLEAKYRRASSHPWEALAPDAPSPD